ncbi:MAG: (2Fe-2S)-binding protein [Alphaproteobacteria bacterium]|nr:(2Fe-2S)-binding protein [Alphaproteobacteria bacterium]
MLRVAPFRTPTVRVLVDGVPVAAHVGESVLAAVLAVSGHVRRAETGDEPRAGFCLMGACQDCWVWFGAGERGRACTTPVRDGMTVFTRPPHAGAGDG